MIRGSAHRYGWAACDPAGRRPGDASIPRAISRRPLPGGVIGATSGDGSVSRRSRPAGGLPPSPGCTRARSSRRSFAIGAVVIEDFAERPTGPAAGRLCRVQPPEVSPKVLAVGLVGDGEYEEGPGLEPTAE